MLLVPLPPAVLDLLLVVNISVAVVLLVTAMYVTSPLEFAVLPSLLLATTMFRLVLNVATTRLILTAGETGGVQAAADDAGQVIAAFSDFVTRGSLTVGIIIFAIIFIIQFVVITKGSTRISEVAARFTLDAMPGKQMAIDADLNAGLLDEAQARKRREEISQEADFYGAMDGASKFTRGDAIAGVIITLVNIAGGMYVGLVDRGWELAPTAELFTKMTIGDGLVSQVPAFITALGAGLIVTRSSTRSELGEQVVGQLTANPKPLYIAAAFLGLMAFTGLPAVPLLAVGGGCAALAFLMERGRQNEADEQSRRRVAEANTTRDEPPPVEKLLEVDAMELEVGLGLVPLVDESRGGDLLERVTLIRRQIAAELGIIVPPVRIRDNLQIAGNDYVVKIRGMAVARGEAFCEQYLAMDSGAATGELPHATPTTEPAFGLPAYWDHRAAAGGGGDHELHRRRGDRRAGDAPDRGHPPARGRTAHPAGRPRPRRRAPREGAGGRRGGRAGRRKARRPAKGAPRPAPRAGADPRPRGDPGNARRRRPADAGRGDPRRILPPRAGPHDLQAARRRGRHAALRHARPGARRPDRPARRPRRERHDLHAAAPDAAGR